MARVEPGQFRVYSELTLEFGGEPITPDLSIYPRESIDLRHDEIRRADPPWVVVEIPSPTQGYHGVMEKVDVYLRHGVKSCWLVSAPLHTVTIFTADGRQLALGCADGSVRFWDLESRAIAREVAPGQEGGSGPDRLPVPELADGRLPETSGRG